MTFRLSIFDESDGTDAPPVAESEHETMIDTIDRATHFAHENHMCIDWLPATPGEPCDATVGLSYDSMGGVIEYTIEKI